MDPASHSEEQVLRLRPLGFGELLDEIFRIYRRHFWLLVAISLVLALPTLLVQILGGQADQLGFTATVFGSLGKPAALAAQQPPSPNPISYLLAYVVAMALTPFVAGAITLAAVDLALGKPVTLSSCLLGVSRRYLALLGQALLFVPLLVTAPCLPLFLWIFVRWSVAVPALLAEGIGPIRAIQRSWELTRDNWWRLFGILLVVYLLALVASTVLGTFALPIAILVPFVSPTIRGAIALTASTLGSALVTPIQFLCIVLLYFDLRIRKESFDLDELARQASGAAPR